MSTNLPAIVDELAAVKAQIAVLEAREKELNRALIATGLAEVCGATTRAKIVTVEDSEVIDYKAAATDRIPAGELWQWSKVKRGCTSVRLYGYN